MNIPEVPLEPLFQVYKCELELGPGKLCNADAWEYDRDPNQGAGFGRLLCREHRTWSWLGTWINQGWSVRLQPKLTSEEWRRVARIMNREAFDEEKGYWDLNLVIRELRRSTSKKIEIVLATPDWWAMRGGTEALKIKVRREAKKALREQEGRLHQSVALMRREASRDRGEK